MLSHFGKKLLINDTTIRAASLLLNPCFLLSSTVTILPSSLLWTTSVSPKMDLITTCCGDTISCCSFMIEHVKPNAYLSEPMKEDKCQEAVSHM